jgi:hypothetical protein
LRRLIEAVPYRVHTVLTDNGTHFTDPAGDAWSIGKAPMTNQFLGEPQGCSSSVGSTASS